MAALTASVMCAACGEQRRSADAADIEELVQRETARGLLAEGGPPTEREIQEVVSKLAVACEPMVAASYDCAIDYGRELGQQHCAVRANASVSRLAMIRCGGDEAPVTTDEFVACESIGAVVSAEDPQGDVTENGHEVSAPVTGSAALEQADLRAVHVAATPDRLCVQWETAAAPDPRYSFNFWVYPPRVSQQGISLAVSLLSNRPPRIGLGPYGTTSGRVGIQGNVTSVLVEADDLPSALRGALDRPFSFAAHSARVIGQTHPDQAYGDELGAITRRLSYP